MNKSRAFSDLNSNVKKQCEGFLRFHCSYIKTYITTNTIILEKKNIYKSLALK